MAYIQIIFNSLAAACLLALAAYGFTLIFRITRAFHLAQAGVYASGAYAYVLGIENFGCSLGSTFLAVLLAMIVTSGLSWLIEKNIYLPIYTQRGNEALTLIGSLGANVVLINLIAIYFGSEVKVVPECWKTKPLEPISGLIITNLQIVQISVSCLVLLILYWILNRSTQLLAFKAVSDNYDLAEVSGLNVKKIRTSAMIGGSLLVLIAGILRTHDIGVEPYSGVEFTLSAAVIAVLTGSIGVLETLLIAIALTLLQNLTEWFLSAQWREGLTFLCLLFVLLWRTEGILSHQIRKDA
jgi:branched-chain amino acid transport system permease protein